MRPEKRPHPDQESAARNLDAENDSSIRDKMQGSFLFTARAYVAAGVAVIPVMANGSKRPAVTWETYQSRPPTDAELVAWFGPHRGIGAVCGAVSGGLEVIDFDDATLFEPWCELVREIAPGLLERLTTHKTPNGFHVIYRCDAVSGSEVLARLPKGQKNASGKNVRIETRGEGAQILVPGCAAECHESGRLYVHIAGPAITDVDSISADERATLFRAARTFDQSEKRSEYWRPFDAPEEAVATGNWELRPGDDFNARANWKDILFGWKALYTKKGVTYWQRPGKSGDGCSATTGHCGDLLYVFSSNASPFDQETAYSKFASYALLNHQGDFRAAAIALADAGHGIPKSNDETDEAPHSRTFRASHAFRAPLALWPEPLAPAAFHGLTGDIVRRIEPHSEADPAALLVQFLVAFGNIIGRTAHFIAESSRHFLNLFAILAGATAKGRKGSSWSNLQRLMMAVEELWCSTRVLGGLASGEGLIWNVRDPIIKREAIKEKGRIVDYQEVEADIGIADKRLLVLEPEFAVVLKVAGRDHNTLSPVIRNAWDTGMLQTLAKNAPAKATNAHISIVGHITREELLRNLNETESANGFANRFLWVCAKRSKLLPDGGSFHTAQIDDLVDRLRRAIMFAQAAGTMKRDDAARAIWHREYARLSDGRGGMLGAILSRAEAQVMRIACLFALLDYSAIVGIEHLEAALAVWDYCERSATYIFGDSLGDAVADELLSLLRSNPDGLTREQIHRAFHRHRRKEEIARGLTILRTKGLAESRQRETGGRPAEVWFPAYTDRTLSTISAESPRPPGDNVLNALIVQPHDDEAAIGQAAARDVSAHNVLNVHPPDASGVGVDVSDSASDEEVFEL